MAFEKIKAPVSRRFHGIGDTALSEIMMTGERISACRSPRNNSIPFPSGSRTSSK